MEAGYIFLFACKYWASDGTLWVLLLLIYRLIADLEFLFCLKEICLCRLIVSLWILLVLQWRISVDQGDILQFISLLQLQVTAHFNPTAIDDAIDYFQTLPLLVFWFSRFRNSGSAMSYWLCKGPAVGASGAIFGLVSHLEVFFFHNSTLASLANAFKQWRDRRSGKRNVC